MVTVLPSPETEPTFASPGNRYTAFVRNMYTALVWFDLNCICNNNKKLVQYTI